MSMQKSIDIYTCGFRHRHRILLSLIGHQQLVTEHQIILLQIGTVYPREIAYFGIMQLSRLFFHSYDVDGPLNM